MPSDASDPYRLLSDHLVQQIDRFLLDHELEDEWVGIVAGPVLDEDEAVVRLRYNVRTIEGPYKRGGYSCDLDYTFEREAVVPVVNEVYPRQVKAVETAFPDAEFRYTDVETERYGWRQD